MNAQDHELDHARCNRCLAQNVLPPSILEYIFGDPQHPSKHTRVLGFSCSECKQVDNFENLEFGGVPIHGGRSPFSHGPKLSVLSLHIVCDHEGCETPLQVVGTRRISTTKESFRAELPTWTPAAKLKCPSQHPISSIRVQE
jgi:hypothetical protein